jgi:Leucine-rich repeat (LRR) protein
LGGNNFSGSIPRELGGLDNLDVLWLPANNLSGPIPPELGNLSNLRFLDLSFNNLDGPIPPELGDLGSLRWLLASNNNLSGPIPATLSSLDDLINLNLSENPDLTCWETFAALLWARGLPFYEGPEHVCGIEILDSWFPYLCSAN